MEKRFIIDVHCHTFNALDLPVEGYLLKVAFRNEPYDEHLKRTIIKLIKNIMLNPAVIIKYSYVFETIILNQKLNKTNGEGDIYTYNLPSNDDISIDEFLDMLSVELKNIRETNENDYKELNSYISKEYSIDSENINDYRFISEEIFGSPKEDLLRDSLRWAYKLTQYRYKIVGDFFEEYYLGHQYNAIACPLLVDYDKWVGDNPVTKLKHQVECMDLNIQYHSGRLLPFFPFDPWREMLHPGTNKGSLERLKKAISKNGFVGVKLYPPMGYRVYNNRELDDFPDKAKDIDDFGEKLDNVLLSLYDYCLENNVPITVHCLPSNETKNGYERRANPKHWKTLFAFDSKYKNLRINLAHFGFQKEILSIINKDNNLYTDCSFWPGALDPNKKNNYINILKKMFVPEEFTDELIGENIKGNNLLKERLMYGTDFIMLAHRHDEDDDKYCLRFEEIYSGAVEDNEDDLNKFFIKNAATFLGLYKEQNCQNIENTRCRLEKFYIDNEMDTPEWLSEVDRLFEE